MESARKTHGIKIADTNKKANTSSSISSNQEVEIYLVEFLFQLIARLKLIIVSAIIGVTLSAFYTQFLVTPLYETTAKLYIVNAGDSAINLSDLQIGTYLTSDYIEVFKTWEVHEMVIANLGLPYNYSQIQSMLTIENPNDTRLLYITVQSPNALEAAAIANEYASVAMKFISDTMATEEPNFMSKALAPDNPCSPNKTRDILLGFFMGVITSVGWITMRFVMDDKIKSVDDVRKYADLPVLAVVPTLTTTTAGKRTTRK